MERLTTRHYDGTGCRVSVGDRTCSCDATARLAAYEDIMSLERAHELAQAEKAGRLVAYLPGDKVRDRFRTPWIVESSEILLIRGELKHLYRCGHPGTDDYHAMFEDEIMPREEAEVALKKMEADNEAD